jgi:hypothetical protein
MASSWGGVGPRFLLSGLPGKEAIVFTAASD